MAAAPHRWDVARHAMTCKRSTCLATIGAGEQYRKVTNADWAYCANCAKTVFNEEPPPQMPARSYAERLAKYVKPDELNSSTADLARKPLDDIVEKARRLDGPSRASGERDDE